MHHIVPITEDWGARLDPQNLITLSKESHGYIESMYGTEKEEETKRKLREIITQYRGREGRGDKAEAQGDYHAI